MTPRPAELRQRPIGEAIAQNGDASPVEEELPVSKTIGIDGIWYDISKFAARHPGGEVIEHFFGKDASTVFYSMGHKASMLTHMKKVGKYENKPRHPADPEFDALVKKFHAEGYFTTDKFFYVQKISVVAMIFALAFALILCFDSFFIHCLGGVALAFTWQQAGFIMHEFMHTQVTRNSKNDHRYGVIFGTMIFGMSAHWWRDEHIIHHSMTNTVDVDKNFADPQMWEGVWAENEKLYPLFQKVYKEKTLFSLLKAYVQYYCIKIQHWTFVPVVMICGRAEILSDSYIKERKPIELVSIVIHWIWITWLFSHLPNWTEILVVYFIAAFVEGMFHFQLILSHYCRLFMDVKDFHEMSWYEFQVLSNMNITTTPLLDWYYGGLNFHIEHHLFPLMARNKLRHAAPYVIDICKRHNIDYESRTFIGCLTMTLSHLKMAGAHYKIDPR